MGRKISIWLAVVAVLPCLSCTVVAAVMLLLL